MRIAIEITRRTPTKPSEPSPPSPAETSRIDWRPFPYERRNPARRGHRDTVTGLARFSGPGRTVEHTMQKSEAHAIAQALGIQFEAIDVAPAQENLQNYDS